MLCVIDDVHFVKYFTILLDTEVNCRTKHILVLQTFLHEMDTENLRFKTKICGSHKLLSHERFEHTTLR